MRATFRTAAVAAGAITALALPTAQAFAAGAPAAPSGPSAGAEGVKPSADGVVLMAGGAGLAAAGAAGLGFSTLRRRRTEG
ncbi:hypothetical protein [Streptomyces sp. NBC_01006]|uniref:hypothetical protein n=1 Tax=Streptomyces sp. NBC_01006 TaxID=2903716 RepID=UPI00386D0269|nr:hypothetical protein OG509_16255 [Streptomyces sp. NBC_01006]